MIAIIIGMDDQYILVQQAICERCGAEYLAAPMDAMIGVAIETFSPGANPVHGLRHPIESSHFAGWYIWVGEYSERADYFKPMHITHLQELYPLALRYLGLAPGWRFLIDDKGYEDVWYDPQLLNI